jgi:hAT family C-terminal dimerisation region
LELIAMALHPVMANVTLSAMARKNPALGNIVQKSKEAMKTALLELGVPPMLKSHYGLDQSNSTKNKEGESPLNAGESKDGDDDDDDDDNDDDDASSASSVFFDMLVPISSCKEDNTTINRSSSDDEPTTVESVINDEVEKYFNQGDTPWAAFVQTQQLIRCNYTTEQERKRWEECSKKRGGVSNEDLITCFKTLFWWSDVGKKEFPLIAHLATQHLAIPDSNAFQERIFSTCTWVGNVLRQKLSIKKYEQQVLLTVNDDFCQKQDPIEEE